MAPVRTKGSVNHKLNISNRPQRLPQEEEPWAERKTKKLTQLLKKRSTDKGKNCFNFRVLEIKQSIARTYNFTHRCMVLLTLKYLKPPTFRERLVIISVTTFQLLFILCQLDSCSSWKHFTPLRGTSLNISRCLISPTHPTHRLSPPQRLGWGGSAEQCKCRHRVTGDGGKRGSLFSAWSIHSTLRLRCTSHSGLI